MPDEAKPVALPLRRGAAAESGEAGDFRCQSVRRRRGRVSRLEFKHGPLFWLVTCLGVAAMCTLVWLLDLKRIYGYAQNLNGLVVFVLMAVPPLLGAPVSILYILGGAKFGHSVGLLIAACAIIFHLMASWWIAHSWLKRPVELLLRKAGLSKPTIHPGEYWAVCLFVALMPGAPYALKNYLLVLAGVPFRQYFWTCLPAHVLTASLAIFFGGFTGSMTGAKIIFLVVYGSLLFAVSRLVVRRLKQRKLSDVDRQIHA